MKKRVLLSQSLVVFFCDFVEEGCRNGVVNAVSIAFKKGFSFRYFSMVFNVNSFDCIKNDVHRSKLHSFSIMCLQLYAMSTQNTLR